MNVTSGLGSFNKDKVANKFGIQLKTKETAKQISSSLSPTIEKRITNEEKSSESTEKCFNDCSIKSEFNENENENENQSSNSSDNFDGSNENKDEKSNIDINQSTITGQTLKKENSNFDLSNININHSTSINLIQSEDRQLFSPCKTIDERQIISNVFIETRTILENQIQIGSKNSLTTNDLNNGSLTCIKRTSIPISSSKTEAEIEHQKDQPLYKRQLSKTLDNVTSLNNKMKHTMDFNSNSTSKW